MSLDKTLWREAMAQYRAWNEAKFVEQVPTAGRKTPAEKWREYQGLFALGEIWHPLEEFKQSEEEEMRWTLSQ
jgi:hypothetical protein